MVGVEVGKAVEISRGTYMHSRGPVHEMRALEGVGGSFYQPSPSQSLGDV